MRLIDADAYEKELAVHHRRNGNVNDYYQKGIRDGLVCAGICLINAPVIEAEPVRHGYVYCDSEGYRRCSVCNEHEGNMPYYSYCPRCGARMDGEESK